MFGRYAAIVSSLFKLRRPTARRCGSSAATRIGSRRRYRMDRLESGEGQEGVMKFDRDWGRKDVQAREDRVGL
jgi:hypothetical protein